jgi:hypothetical protein
MKSTSVVLAGVTSIVALAGTISVISGCNSGSGDVVSACTSYCEHFASCEGIGGSQIDDACRKSCVDAGANAVSCGGDGGSLTRAYDCLAALPCSELTSPDAGVSAITTCLQQSGCP